MSYGTPSFSIAYGSLVAMHWQINDLSCSHTAIEPVYVRLLPSFKLYFFLRNSQYEVPLDVAKLRPFRSSNPFQPISLCATNAIGSCAIGDMITLSGMPWSRENIRLSAPTDAISSWPTA